MGGQEEERGGGVWRWVSRKNFHLRNRRSEDEVWDWYIFLRNCISKNMYRKVSSVQFSLSVVSDSLRSHGLQHTRPPCLSPNPRVEFTQTHVHWVGNAIQPPHPLSSLSPPAFNLCQHQGLFRWISSLHQVVKVLEFQLLHQSFQWIFRTEFL